MHIAILTFDGFNELDSLIALGILNRVKNVEGWRVSLATPTPQVTSMNGVKMEGHITLEEAADADAVIFGSGSRTRDIAADPILMGRLSLIGKNESKQQLIASQCSGALLVAKLGLLGDAVPVCTDLITRPWVVEAGVEVLNQPFFAKGNVATAGGCLASHYLATWVLAKLLSVEAAKDALSYVVPVGEKDEYIERALKNVECYL